MELGCTTKPKFVLQYAVEEETLSPFLSRMRFQAEQGRGEMGLLKVYPGIQVWSIDFHMDRLDIRPMDNYHYLKLNYCMYGGCEVPLPGERYIYISQGRLSVDSNPPVGEMRLPTGEYVGLEIVIDLETLHGGEPPAWAEYGVQIRSMARDLLDKQGSCLVSASREWAGLARQMYQCIQSNDAALEDCRFRLLHLLWALKGETQGRLPAQNRTYLTLGQRETVLRAKELLTRDLRNRYTISHAAALVGVSPASLKKYFAIMFGVPISTYMRRLRISTAKELLTGGKESIADIAGDVGYENQGKFGAVFRRETGVTPLEYRRRHRSDIKVRGESL